jgi:hypothetical protein
VFLLSMARLAVHQTLDLENPKDPTKIKGKNPSHPVAFALRCWFLPKWYTSGNDSVRPCTTLPEACQAIIRGSRRGPLVGAEMGADSARGRAGTRPARRGYSLFAPTAVSSPSRSAGTTRVGAGRK